MRRSVAAAREPDGQVPHPGQDGMVFKADLLPRPTSGGSNAVEDEDPMTFAIKLVKSIKKARTTWCCPVPPSARSNCCESCTTTMLSIYTMYTWTRGTSRWRSCSSTETMIYTTSSYRASRSLWGVHAQVAHVPDPQRCGLHARRLGHASRHEATEHFGGGSWTQERTSQAGRFGSGAYLQGADQGLVGCVGHADAADVGGTGESSRYNHVVQMGRERKYPTQSELKNAVKVGQAVLEQLCSTCSRDCWNMVGVFHYPCTLPNPETRITAKEALEHEYFKEIEPEPRDWAFDEPGKEPVSFRTQTVEPVADESLPWKGKKDGAAGADAKTEGAGSPHRDNSASRSSQHHNDHRGRDGASRSRSHHNSRDVQQQPQRRSDRSNAGDNNARDNRNRGQPGGGNAQGAWRERSSGRAGGAGGPAVTGAKRPGGGERPTSASSSGRPRSPKQPRRR
ncbi:hypothetical protein GQ600_9729 [Phytophthora cactorum]|nr:hypothetical protein GQ600_9729 [Phytophthora cactorum]